MTWLQRHRIRLYLRNSLWVLPTLSIVAALVAIRVTVRIDWALGWRSSISPDTARVIMSTIAASTFTLVVLVSSAILLAIQLASAQLTPRIIATIYRSPYGKLAFAVFVFTFTFSVATLVRIEQTVPLVTGYVAAYSFLLNLALFIFFIDSLGKTLRPSSALRVIGLAGREVIQSVYPSLLSADSPLPQPPRIGRNGGEPRVVLNRDDGAVLAFDKGGLITKAIKSNCVIELVPPVRDFIAAGDPLFRVHSGGRDLPDRRLCDSVAG